VGEGPGAVVVGTGFGARIHVPALRAAGFKVEALVGTDPQRTARRAGRLGVRALTDLDQALAIAGVDAVTVATPPDAHLEVVSRVLAAGRHVVCEKPFARDGAEARAMRDRARSAGVVALVGHEFRFAPERALLARLVVSGAVGAPRLATLVSHIDLLADPDAAMPPWWFDAGRGGGWLGASGSHLVDQLRTWLGPLGEVSARLDVASGRPEGSAEDSFALLVRSRAGVTGVLQQTAAARGPSLSVTRVVGDGGSVWIEGSAVWLADADGTRQVSIPADLALGGPAVHSDDPRHRFSHLELAPYTRLAAVWRRAIRGEAVGSGPAPATFDDGVAVTDVLDAARRSAASGGGLEATGE
jgi:predicted dehydrogenase